MGGKLTRRILLATVVAIFAAAPASAQAAPVWEIVPAWAPTHLPPGGTGSFYVGASNRPGDRDDRAPAGRDSHERDGTRRQPHHRLGLCRSRNADGDLLEEQRLGPELR